MNPTCSCDTPMQPMGELGWWELQPDPITKKVSVNYLCPVCMMLEQTVFEVPEIERHNTRNLLREINMRSRATTWSLLVPITLSTPDKASPFYETIMRGKIVALEELIIRKMVDTVDWETMTLSLTMLGWIALLHAAY